jgi:hypothetical protein
VAFKADATQDDHLVIAFDLLKSLFQDLDGVLSIACEELLERARDARRRLLQAVPFRIVSRPPDDGADRGLDFGSAGPLALGLRCSCAIQRMDSWAHWDAFHDGY